MTIERAIKVVKDLRDYAFQNWDEIECEEQLDEIEKAVDVIVLHLSTNGTVGTAEIDGKKYVISKAE